MLLPAAPIAVYPNSSLNAPGVAIAYVRDAACRCHSVRSGRCFAEMETLTVAVLFSRAIGRGKRGDSFGSVGCHPVRIPSSARGHASGLSVALRQARPSASASPPCGLRFPASPDPPQMQSFGLGRRGHSLGFA